MENQRPSEVLEKYLEALEDIYNAFLDDDFEAETSNQFLSAKELRDCYQSIPYDWNQP